MPRVLLAGLTDEAATWLKRRLPGASVGAVRTGNEVLNELARTDWSLLVVDHNLTEPGALEVLRQVRRRAPTPGDARGPQAGWSSGYFWLC